MRSHPLCSRWQSVLPPVHDVAEDQRWVVHRTRTVNGLGDFLAGFLSALVLASATQSRLFVDHGMNSSLVSFAPYDVAPPASANNRTVRSFNKCPEWEELSGAQVVYYEGISPSKPANRACASMWREHLGRVWRALGVDETSDPLWDRRPTLVYGCLLHFFRPLPAITQRIPLIDPKRTIVAVHVRAGDKRFEARNCETTTEFEDELAREIVAIARTLPGDITFRVESDDACVRDAVVRAIVGDGFDVAPPISRPSHNVKDSADQLASWFALAHSDAFLVSPMYHPREGVLLWYDKYFPVRGFTDHGLLRLSSWSVMAALRAGTDRFHVLCAKPKPNGMDALLQRHHLKAAALVRPYVCDSTRKSAVGLAPKMGVVHALPSENAHYQDPQVTNATIWWGIGTLA